jgi:hypothetical protein
MRNIVEPIKERFTDAELRRLLFYGDILVVGVFVLALAFLIRNTYLAGWYLGAGDAAARGDHLTQAAVHAVLMLASLGWVLVRFFRDQLRDLRNPWS